MVPAAGVFRGEDLVGELGATRAEREILVYLAERGEGTRYGAAREMGAFYSTVHGAFRRLRRRGWIRKVRDERSSHNVLRSVYRPTATGLLCAFLLKPESPSIFRRTEELFPLPLRFSEGILKSPLGREFMGRSVCIGIGKVLESGIKPTKREIKNFVRETIKNLIHEYEKKEFMEIAEVVATDRGWSELFQSAIESEREWFLEMADVMGRALDKFKSSGEKSKKR